MDDVTQALVTKAATALLTTISKAGYSWFTSSKYNDYEKELLNVIDRTISEYKTKYPKSKSDKTAFYESLTVTTELLKFRLTKEFHLADVKSAISEDDRVQMPTKEELGAFLEIFSSKIEESQNLKQLNIDNNYKDEIFNVSGKLDKIFDKLTTTISALSEELNNKELTEEWKLQLDEISDNVYAFKPKTALDRLQSLEKRIREKGISISGTLEGKLIHLKATCLNELNNRGIESNQAELFIKASKLWPTNEELKTNAAFSLYVIGEKEKARELSEEILKNDEFNSGGWIVRTYLQGENAIEFLNSVPTIVKGKKDFKMHIRHWLSVIGKIQTMEDVDKLGLGFDFQKEPLPDKIVYKNKGFWMLNTDCLLNMLFFKYKLFGSTGLPQDAFADPLFKYLKNLFEMIVDAVKGTEIDENYGWYKFQLAYLISNQSKEVSDLMETERFYATIKKPTYLECVQMVQLYNSKQTSEDILKSIAIINNFGEEKHEILLVFNAFNYMQLKKYDESIASFKKYLLLAGKVGEEQFYNIMEYLEIVKFKLPSHLAKVKEEILAFNFEKGVLKELFITLTEGPSKDNKSLIDKKLKELATEITNKNIHLRYYVALAFYVHEHFDSVVEYLKDVIDYENPSNELNLYCLSTYSGGSDKLELLKLLGKLRLKRHYNYQLIAIEISLYQSMGNWIKMEEVARYGVESFPSHGKLLYTLFFAHERSEAKEKIRQDFSLIKGKDFEEDIAMPLSGILFRGGLISESVELLYQTAVKPFNKKARQAYFTSIANYPKETIKHYTKAELGTYVKYKYKEKETPIHLTDDAIKTFPGKDLVGKSLGDKITFQLPMSQVFESAEIVRISDKYGALLDEIITEMANPMSGYEVKVIQMKPDATPDELRKQFIDELGAKGSVEKDEYNKRLELYYRGEISFTELCKSVFQSKAIDTYLYLTSSLATQFRSIPLTISSALPQIETIRFSIDFTSLCLLHELEIGLGMKYQSKFLISPFLITELRQLIEDAKIAPEQQLFANISLDGFSTYQPPAGHSKRRLDYLLELKKWIDQNCEVDNVQEKLNSVEDLASNFQKDEYLNYLIDNRIITDRPDHFLLTNDVIYYRVLHGNTSKIVSPMLFLLTYYPEKNGELLKFMLSRNYVGLTLNFETLKDEYIKLATGEQNKFSLCLENLNHYWNPTSIHLDVVAQFLRWLYLTSTFLDKKRIALSVLVAVLDGCGQSLLIYMRNQLAASFKLMGSNYKEILEVYADSLRIIATKNS